MQINNPPAIIGHLDYSNFFQSYMILKVHTNCTFIQIHYYFLRINFYTKYCQYQNCYVKYLFFFFSFLNTVSGLPLKRCFKVLFWQQWRAAISLHPCQNMALPFDNVLFFILQERQESLLFQSYTYKPKRNSLSFHCILYLIELPAQVINPWLAGIHAGAFFNRLVNDYRVCLLMNK